MKRFAVVVFFALLASSFGFSQTLDSTASDVSLSASLPESLTVDLNASSVNFDLQAGRATNAGSAAVTINTKWVLNSSRTSVKLYGYFDSATAALTGIDSAANVPSSAISAIVDGTTIGTLSNTIAGIGAANGAVQLFSQAITDSNRNSSKSVSLTLNVDVSSLPQLPADTYNGTLHIQAAATL